MYIKQILKMTLCIGSEEPQREKPKNTLRVAWWCVLVWLQGGVGIGFWPRQSASRAAERDLSVGHRQLLLKRFHLVRFSLMEVSVQSLGLRQMQALDQIQSDLGGCPSYVVGFHTHSGGWFCGEIHLILATNHLERKCGRSSESTETGGGRNFLRSRVRATMVGISRQSSVGEGVMTAYGIQLRQRLRVGRQWLGCLCRGCCGL